MKGIDSPPDTKDSGQNGVVEEISNTELFATSVERIKQNIETSVSDLWTEISTSESMNETANEQKISIFEYFREKMNKELKAVILAASTLFPSPSLAGGEELPQTDVDGELVEQAVEQAENMVEIRLAELKEKVKTDNFETVHVFYGNPDNLQEIVNFQGEEGGVMAAVGPGEAFDAFQKTEEIKSSESGPLKKVTLHNHPIEIIDKAFGIPEHIKQQIEIGEGPDIVAPPGPGDMWGGAIRLEYGTDNEEYVVGPSGVWLAKPDMSSDYYKEILEVKTNFVTEVQASDDEEEIIIIFEAYLDKMDGIEDEYEEIMDRAQEIRSQLIQGSINGEDVSELIEEYIGTANQIGYNLSYTPNERGALPHQPAVNSSGNIFETAE